MNTPVLMTIFNRPDYAEQTFAMIRKARPPKLYIAADGPRSDRPLEGEKCAATRAIVDHIDWECEVHTLFREQNIGCKMAISGAISWFFEHEERGIILEDDCVPEPSFFRFCDEMLERYASDSRVGMISGNNHYSYQTDPETSYHFSKIGRIWGWATWRRAWNVYDVELDRYHEIMPSLRNSMGQTARFREMFFSMIDRAKAGDINTWDVQWVLSIYANDMFTIRPKVNLVANIGFGNASTHTSRCMDRSFTRSEALEFPLKHPQTVEHDFQADRRYEKRLYPNSLPRRLIRQMGVGAALRKLYLR